MSDKLRFGEILVRAGVLSREALEQTFATLDEQTDLGEMLVAQGHLDEAALLGTIGRTLNLPSVRLTEVVPDPKALELVDRADCIEHFLLPISIEQGKTGAHLHVAMANPADVRAIKKVTRKARLRIRPLVALASEIRAAVARAYGGAMVPGPADLRPASQAAARKPASPPTQDTPLFDFGVEDLSSLDAEAPPPPPAAALASTPQRSAFGGPPSPSAAAVASLAAARNGGEARGPEVTVKRRPSVTEIPALSEMGARMMRAPSMPELPALGLSADLADDLDDLALSAVSAAPAPLPDRDRERLVALRRSAPPADLRAPRTAPPPPPPMTSLPATPARVLTDGLPNVSVQRRTPTESQLPAISARGITNAPASQAALSNLAFDPRSGPPAPAGMVDGGGESDRLDMARILDRFVTGREPREAGGDQVIAQALDRYGAAPGTPGEAVFSALDGALLRTGSMSGRLTVVLIRQLARRGLVDPAALLADLKKVTP